ncbi:MAG: mucoidy inhibitor MuiA family protein [Pseudomonadota bacterium]
MKFTSLRTFSAALAMSTVLMSPAFSASLDVDSSVSAATIYPGAASVTRQVPFTLPAGEHEILVELKGAGIDHASLRVAGVSEGDVILRGVDTRNVEKTVDTGERRRQLEEQIAELNLQLANIGQRQTIAETQAQLVTNLVNAIPAAFSSEAEGVVLPDPAQILSLLETVGQAQSKVVEARLALQTEEQEAREEIAVLQLELSALPSRRNVLEAVIRVNAQAQSEGTLELSYLTSAVSWQPSYDLALDTLADTPSLAIRSQASITQRTGEDWNDVALTLSTARPSGATEAGTLPSEQISFLQPRPAPMPMARSKQAGRPALESMVQSDVAELELAQPVTVGEEAAAAQFAGYRATFTIAGTSNLTSGDGARTVLIDQSDVDVDLETRATPLLSTEAYLHAAGTVPDDLTILPGQASLSRDGDLVGRTFMPRLAAGADFDFGFGADDSVTVERIVADRSTGETGILTSANRERMAITMSVSNLGGDARTIRLIDRVPTSDADEIEIETSFPGDSTPDEVDVDGRRGVLGWTFDLAPGAGRRVEVRHTITWPSDKEIMRDGIWPVRPRG